MATSVNETISGDGIRVWYNMHHQTITGNMLVGGGKGTGINIPCSNNVVEANYICEHIVGIRAETANTSSGMAYADTNTVNANICTNMSEYGIHIGGTNNSITGNNCNNNTKAGISLIYRKANTITGNVCNNNGAGIYLDRSDYNSISGNTCIDNNYGIYLYSQFSGQGVPSKNVIVGNVCIRGTGLTSDYTSNQNTIYILDNGTANNIIVYNHIMGKNYVVVGDGSSNVFEGNKYE